MEQGGQAQSALWRALSKKRCGRGDPLGEGAAPRPQQPFSRSAPLPSPPPTRTPSTHPPGRRRRVRPGLPGGRPRPDQAGRPHRRPRRPRARAGGNACRAHTLRCGLCRQRGGRGGGGHRGVAAAWLGRAAHAPARRPAGCERWQWWRWWWQRRGLPSCRSCRGEQRGRRRRPRGRGGGRPRPPARPVQPDEGRVRGAAVEGTAAGAAAGGVMRGERALPSLSTLCRCVLFFVQRRDGGSFRSHAYARPFFRSSPEMIPDPPHPQSSQEERETTERNFRRPPPPPPPRPRPPPSPVPPFFLDPRSSGILPAPLLALTPCS